MLHPFLFFSQKNVFIFLLKNEYTYFFLHDDVEKLELNLLFYLRFVQKDYTRFTRHQIKFSFQCRKQFSNC